MKKRILVSVFLVIILMVLMVAALPAKADSIQITDPPDYTPTVTDWPSFWQTVDASEKAMATGIAYRETLNAPKVAYPAPESEVTETPYSPGYPAPMSKAIPQLTIFFPLIQR